MKKSFSVFYILLSFIICGCSKNTISTGSKSYTSTSDSIADSSKEITQKYITAKKVYDLEYDADGCPEEALTLDEFPDLTFRRDESKAAFLIEGRETIIDPKQIGAKGIYLADVNSDGFTDLAYYQDRRSGSSNISYLVKIYDYHNDKFLFNDGNNKNSILDLDDDGVLVIEELGRIGSGLNELNRAGRFLAGNEISFEWFSFDSKLKSIRLEFVGRNNGEYVAYLNQKTDAMLQLNGIGSESLDKAFPIEQINVKRNDDFYSYNITNGSTASLFNIDFTFIKEGIIELEVSIGQVVTTERVRVIS